MLTPENESTNLHLTHRENRMSDTSSVIKISRLKGVLFSTSVEVRLGNVGLSVVCYQFSRITGLRIFLIFCMNVPYYKDKKET